MRLIIDIMVMCNSQLTTMFILYTNNITNMIKKYYFFNNTNHINFLKRNLFKSITKIMKNQIKK